MKDKSMEFMKALAAPRSEMIAKAPFAFTKLQGQWAVMAADGVDICCTSAMLVDVSGRRGQYPDGVIRSEDERQREAQFVVRALNAAWASGDRP
jgi:hypothetical protein